MEKLNAAFIAFIACVIFIRLFIHIAKPLNLLDMPSDRKTHTGAIPVVGGIAVFLSFLLGIFSSVVDLNILRNLIISLLVVVSIGFIDDIKDLAITTRVLAHIVAVLFIFNENIQITSLGNIFYFFEFNLGIFALLFTILAIIGSINSINMIDGIDGLASIQALISLTSIIFFSYINSIELVYSLSILLVATILPFLLFNLNFFGEKYKVFLGDAGTTFLGFIICILVIILSQKDPKVITPVTALWIMAFPVIDTLATVLRRIRKGVSPFKADREHLHHFFVRSGFSDKQTLLVVSVISFTLSSIGVLFEIYNLSESLSFLIFLISFVAYFYILSHAWKVSKKVRDKIS